MPVIKRVTARDVAAAAGVSRATVSYVFNQSARIAVAPATRERVLGTARALGYTPNPLARGLAGKPTGVIGVVMGQIAVNYVGLSIVQAICRTASAARYEVLITDAAGEAGRERAQVRVLLDRAVDGLIFNGPYDEANVRLARDAGRPLVMVERYVQVPGVPGISTDNAGGSALAVEHLVALGHRRLGYVGLTDLHPADHDRFHGALQAARRCGAEIDGAWVHRSAEHDAGSTYSFARTLFRSTAGPTAIYAGGNLFAIEVLRAAHDHGLRVPADLSVISFDDQYAEFTYPRLTTVSTLPKDLAATAMTLLLDGLRHAKPPRPVPPSVVLRPQLTVRETTGAAPSGRGASG